MKFDIEKAINSRSSIRSYENKGLDQETKDLIQEFIDELTFPFEHTIEMKWFNAEYNKKLYTMFDSPKDNLAFISETDYLSISKTGFVGELVILYMTSLGLSTCWMGHYLSTYVENEVPLLKEDLSVKYGYGKDIVEGKRVICTSPVGYYKNKGLRLMDRMQQRIFSFKRKPVEEIVVGSIDNLSDDILYALDLAGKAPSALNQQFWRFTISEDQKTISLAMPVGYKHMKWDHPNIDIGICACHFWLALKNRGIDADPIVTLDCGRAVWHFQL